MKRRFSSFLSGFLACALIVGVSVSALAISGRMTIEVDPISIQVNGYPFAPIDAKGNDVPIFAYNGTTYAPLRALAEAYGLTVGYDAETNMATVTDPEAAPAPSQSTTTAQATAFEWSDNEEEAYEQFKSLWDIFPFDSLGAGQVIYSGRYNGELEHDELIAFLEQLGEDRLDSFALRFATDVAAEHNIAYNGFSLIAADGLPLYRIETKNGESTIYEKNQLFQ